MTEDEIRSFRIDVPTVSGQTVLYFFVPRDSGRWDPWWNQLIRYLLDVGPRQPHRTHPETGTPMEIAIIDGDQRARLLDLLLTAPEAEIKGHRTLRRALELLPRTEGPVRVVYFGAETPSV